MIGSTRCFSVLVLAALLPAPAFAQSRPGPEVPPGPASATTSLGDTGLWFVPAAEVLPAGILAAGVSAATEARDQRHRKASYGSVSLARGLLDWAEVFGAWQMTTGIDGRHGRGDLVAGVKVALLSERQGAPFALAARTAVKMPTGSEEAGVSSGQVDVLAEIVASRRFGRAEVTGSTGVVGRGDPDGSEAPNGIRSGIGIGILARPSLRLFGEIHGESYRGEAGDARLVSPFDMPPTVAAGLAWNVANSLSVSVAASRAVGGPGETRGFGAGVRVGFRPGIRRPATPATTSREASGTEPRRAPGPPPPPAPAVRPASDDGASTTIGDFAFADVHFDLDRATLRPEGLAVLDRVVTALSGDRTVRLQIDGHTCEIGTSEYNLALGERRASAVRAYLISRGIAADRLLTASFGEERPKHDMRTEETRALNRRAELRPLSSPGFAR